MPLSLRCTRCARLVSLLALGCQAPAPQGPPIYTPLPESLRPTTPPPITVQDTRAEVRVFEGETPIVAVVVGGPEDATVERSLPGDDHRMHTIAVTVGRYDAAHSEQILIVRYETEGTSFREVIRCPLKTPVLRFAGGRRLEIIVQSIPEPPAEAEVEATTGAEAEEATPSETESDVWVIPPE
ncbi:MAG: hypothetical protein ACPHRO_07015 [Nannocystaceae bacterium]